MKSKSLDFGLTSTAADAAVNDTIAVPATVCLIDAADPFGQAMRDCLLGLGVGIHDEAPYWLLIGTGDVADGPSSHLVAIGKQSQATALAHAGRRLF